MTKLQHDISYLRGLAEGMDLTKNSKEGKIITELLNVIEDMSDSIIDLEDNQDDLEEYIEAIDADLDDLEEETYGDIDFDFTCDFEDDELDEFNELDEELFEVECPTCNNTIYVEEKVINDDFAVLELSCPNCKELYLANK